MFYKYSIKKIQTCKKPRDALRSLISRLFAACKTLNVVDDGVGDSGAEAMHGHVLRACATAGGADVALDETRDDGRGVDEDLGGLRTLCREGRDDPRADTDFRLATGLVGLWWGEPVVRIHTADRWRRMPRVTIPLLAEETTRPDGDDGHTIPPT